MTIGEGQPPSPVFLPSDETARQAIRENLDETLFVEASAGTGKTSSLVARVVNLVTTGRATLDRIAAITFTEAAAAELRDRIRQELEKAAEDDSRSEEDRQRCRQGVADLDQAAIRTLHAFAAMLLHERPLEAGLPPGFETTDEIAAGIRFNEAWNAWLDTALDEGSPLATHLAKAITLGMTLAQLRGVALEFHRNYVDLVDASFGNAASPTASAARHLAESGPELARLCQYSRLGNEDGLFSRVQGKLPALRRLFTVEAGTPSAYRLMLRTLPLRTNAGNQGNWDKDPESGKNACAQLKGLLRELDSAASEDIAQARQAVLLPILEGLRQFALDYAEQRRQEGRAEFHDLLVWARELLRDNLEVRDHFRRRFSHLLIDEAQDTDPTQAEIAMYLAESVPDAADESSRPASWEQITPAEGKLFVVGDPKQSIYRFRRADVAQMKQLQQRMDLAGGRRVGLVQNFRSQKRVVDWVNHVFGQWMSGGDEGGSGEYVQSKYEEMSPRWDGDTGAAFRPRVWALEDTEYDGNIAPVRKLEADDIATLLRQMVSQEWQTLDREATEAQGREVYRPVRYSDICILMPRRTGLQALERGLESQDIPYRLESASLIFETQEVRDLLNCLRAIDDPADEVATVAALRSPAFGCSDVDLLLHYENGGRFEYLRETHRQPEGPVSEALAILRTFHDERVWNSVGTLIDSFVRDRELMEAAVGHLRMREQWRRYRFLVERAMQFVEAGGNSLRAFVGWVEDQMQENARVTEVPVPESDEEAVRIMTVHAAKGLEFPVVILTGINSPRRNSTNAALFNRHHRQVEVRIGSGDNQFATEGHDELADSEKRMSEAEQVRLMYVAATRARDHLVLSLRRTGKDSENTAAGAISALLEDTPELWEPVVLVPSGLPVEIVAEDAVDTPSPAEHSLEARDRWIREREELLHAMSRPASAAATALGHSQQDGQDEKEEQETDEPWKKGRAGSQTGRAVHAVLQATDLATGDDIADRAGAQASAEGVPDEATEVERLARVAIASDVVKRAVASARLWREVPVAVAMAGGSLHGFIDLLFEEEDGLVVVDYKTDSVRASDLPEAVNRYRLQGGAYSHAVQQLTGKPVKEVVFLYLRANREERLQNLPGAMAEAAVQAESLLGVA